MVCASLCLCPDVSMTPGGDVYRVFTARWLLGESAATASSEGTKTLPGPGAAPGPGGRAHAPRAIIPRGSFSLR